MNKFIEKCPQEWKILHWLSKSGHREENEGAGQWQMASNGSLNAVAHWKRGRRRKWRGGLCEGIAHYGPRGDGWKWAESNWWEGGNGWSRMGGMEWIDIVEWCQCQCPKWCNWEFWGWATNVTKSQNWMTDQKGKRSISKWRLTPNFPAAISHSSPKICPKGTIFGLKWKSGWHRPSKRGIA